MAKKKGDQGFTFSPQCFTLTLDIFPAVVMGRENALKLATNLAVHQDLTDIHMSDESWTFRRPQTKGQSRGHIEVAVEDQEITIEHQSPNGGLERFEILAEQTVEAIGDAIKPQMVFGILVTLEYTANIGSDARKAILGSLGMFGDANGGDEGPGKLAAFERPCHFVGIRLGFPPYDYAPDDKDTEADEKEESEAEAADGGKIMDELIDPKLEQKLQSGADWAATITIQSLQDDPESIMVEVSGRWMGPIRWGQCKDLLSHRLKIVDEFLKTKTTEFLRQFRSNE